MLIVIMGVSGSGKTTIGQLLASQLGWPFYDADDYHSAANKLKMSGGTPLTDQDRLGWLAALAELLRERSRAKGSLVLACSALKRAYRDILRVEASVRFVYLQGTHAQIEARLAKRTGHYMKAQLLKSQFAELEEPDDCFVVGVNRRPDEIVAIIRAAMQGALL
jgi:gluconokinase